MTALRKREDCCPKTVRLVDAQDLSALTEHELTEVITLDRDVGDTARVYALEGAVDPVGHPVYFCDLPVFNADNPKYDQSVLVWQAFKIPIVVSADAFKVYKHVVFDECFAARLRPRPLTVVYRIHVRPGTKHVLVMEVVGQGSFTPEMLYHDMLQQRIVGRPPMPAKSGLIHGRIQRSATMPRV